MCSSRGMGVGGGGGGVLHITNLKLLSIHFVNIMRTILSYDIGLLDLWYCRRKSKTCTVCNICRTFSQNLLHLQRCRTTTLGAFLFDAWLW